MEQSPTPRADPAHLFAHGGDMGRRIRDMDWSTSPLGEIADWPGALRYAVAALLPSGAEMALFWGADFVVIYNDAFAATIGARRALVPGRPAGEMWAESWETLHPLLKHVRDTGDAYVAKDRLFTTRRGGREEEVFFDVSYSPVPLDDGSIGGVLCIVSETTQRVVAARSVAEERERLHLMFDQAPGFVAILREPGHVIELANAACRDVFDGADLVGTPLPELFSENARAALTERLDEVASTGRPYRGVDVPLRLGGGPDGGDQKRWLDFILQPVSDTAHDGGVSAIFVQAIDLTDRHRAEAALAMSRDSLELATEAGGIGTWQYDVLADHFSSSPRTWEIYGVERSAQPLSRDAFREVIHKDDRDMVRDAFMATIDPARRAPYDIEYRTSAAVTGAVRWLAVKGRGIFEGERCVRATGVITDVTQRRQEAQALRESEARFRTLADSLPALVWLTDEKGTITFASDGFQTILGYSDEEVKRGGWFALYRPDDRAVAEARYKEMWTAPHDLSGDYRLARRDGTLRWFHIEARARYLGDRLLGYIGCAIDVTEAHAAGERLEARVTERTAELTRQIAERQRVEETLHQMQRLEAIGQLTSGIAHDFNNLLTVVLGNVEMIGLSPEGAKLEPATAGRLDHIRIAAERGATLTAQLLAFARRQRLEAKAIDLNEAVERLAGLLGSTLGRSIGIEARMPSDLWPAMVDPTQIELIILNLAINARDAMTNGGTLTITTGNVVLGQPARPEEPLPGEYIRVAVSDTGTGMSEAVLSRAFEPFFTTKEIGKGSGLGLAQVFGFAKQSGGGVRIETRAGEGTTVSVFLPRALHPVAPSDQAEAPRIGVPVAGRTILVLDDEAGVRQVTADTLRSAGCTVIESADGSDALDILAETPAIDAVVTDVVMAGMSGIEFARAAERSRPALPIVFVTGHAELADIAEVPADRVLHKPFERRALIDRLQAALDG